MLALSLPNGFATEQQLAVVQVVPELVSPSAARPERTSLVTIELTIVPVILQVFILHDFKLFRIRTYGIEAVSLKTRDLNSFRMRTYEKQCPNWFRMRTYKKWGGYPALIIFALFCSSQDLNLLIFMLLQILWQKYRGGVGSSRER